MYTDQLPRSAFQELCLLLPVWRENRGQEGCVLLYVFMLGCHGALKSVCSCVCVISQLLSIIERKSKRQMKREEGGF